MGPVDAVDAPAAAPLGWDEYFMLQAVAAGLRSKDPSTKVGCVIVDPDNRQAGMGYNGFVAGIDETGLPWDNDVTLPLSRQKYGHVIHAESNALLHATKDLKGARLYVTLFPCHECAKLIASKGVAEVIYLSDKHRDSPKDHLRESNRTAKVVLGLAGVRHRRLALVPGVLRSLERHIDELVRSAPP